MQQPAGDQLDEPSRAQVEQARERLAGLGELSAAEQVDAFDTVHRLLQDALAAVEQDLRGDDKPGRG